MTDQYTFRNPVTAYETISPPEQHQPEPGLDAELAPRADLGEETYRGTGRLDIVAPGKDGLYVFYNEG